MACKKLLALVFAAGLLAASAQEAPGQTSVYFGSSPNPVGSGARALGMGGAFIGVADDATAASWNPGGLVQLKNPEISFVVEGYSRKESSDFGPNHPEADGSTTLTQEDLNYASVVYPFNWLNRNMAVSLNYQKLYDFNRDLSFPITLENDQYTVDMEATWRQEGSLSALGLAYCIQIVPSLSAGFTLNYWDDAASDNSWKEKNRFRGTLDIGYGPMPFDDSKTQENEFDGFNANIGLLWHASEELSVGVVLKTPFTADIRRTTNNTTRLDETAPEDLELDMPLSFGIGVAYRFTDSFRMSADVYRTEWDDFVYRDSSGNETSAVSGKPLKDSDVDPTYQVRLGAEYLISNQAARYTVPIRAGLFYDPSPAEGSPDDFWGISIGSGISFERFSIDAAYQYRFGNDVNSSAVGGQGVDFGMDVDEHTGYLSFILYF